MSATCRQAKHPVLYSSLQRPSFQTRPIFHHNKNSGTETNPKASRRELLGFSVVVPTLLLGPTSSEKIPSRYILNDCVAEGAMSRENSIYDFKASIYGAPRSLNEYKDQVLVAVNVARLRKLVEKYGSQGFNLIAFPCNQFGGQAPGTSEEEREYAVRKFGFQFDVFDKIDVNGVGAHPLYRYLRGEQPISSPEGYTRPNVEKGAIEWNYTKFLINREGKPVRRYTPSFDPLDFEGDVANVLKGKDPLPIDCLLHPERSQCLF